MCKKYNLTEETIELLGKTRYRIHSLNSFEKKVLEWIKKKGFPE